jgi:hypothetical protein
MGSEFGPDGSYVLGQ